MFRTNQAARRACRIAAVLAALAISPPARAERPRKGTAAKPAAAATEASQQAATPATSPAPSAAGPATTTLAAAPAAAPGGSGFLASRGPSSVGLGVGYFSAGKGSGLAVHMDYGFAWTPPSWSKLDLELRMRAMYAMPSKDTGLSRAVLVGFMPLAVPTGTEKASASVVEVGPFARVRLALAPKFAAFADLGVGVAQTFEKYDRDEMYIGRSVVKKNVTTVYLGGAVGLSYEINERWRAMIPLAFSAQAGSDYSAFLPTLAIAYRL